MTKENFIDLLNGLQEIQLESLNDKGIVMWIFLNNYTQPMNIHTMINVTLFFCGKKTEHSYNFYEEEEPKNVWNSLDDIHKRFRKRPILRDLVKELKEEFK